jgi:putative membrane protein insertion efficiency factor
MKYIALILIKFYKYAISPHFPPCCRYYPSCSTYAYEAICEHGFLRGSFMALRRLLRCHPFHAGGYDPVPEHKH